MIEPGVKGYKNFKHGHTSSNPRWQSRTHASWSNMHARTSQPKRNRHEHYFDKGIKVCERWKVFANFLEDMGERPDGLSLDRIDVDGDYCKENCRWATPKEQANNRTNNRSRGVAK